MDLKITGYALCLTALLFMFSCEKESGTERTDRGRTLDYSASVTFHANGVDTVATLQTAVADTDASRSAGLMDIHDMPMNKGMLFIFEEEGPRSFWMANTPLALDIIFVNAEMEIVRIQRNTQPYSERNVLSESPAMYVVEANAGYTLQHDIQEGMHISVEL